MPIDTSIYNNIQPVKIDSPLNMLAQVSQLKNMQSQNRLADLAYGQKQKQIADSAAVNDAYKGAIGSDGAIDRTKLYGAIASSGQGAQLPGIQKALTEADTATLAQKKAMLDNHLKQFEVVGQIMSGVKDQATYDQARQQIAQILGPEAAAHQPQQYDPNVIEQARQKAMSVKDQMVQASKAIDQQLAATKFGYQQQHDSAVLGETRRHNSATEQNAAATLAGADGGISPDAITNAAARYNIDGTLPPLGIGKAGAAVRTAVLNKAAELAAQNGQSPDQQRISQINNKSNTAALTQLQKQQTMVGAFEKNFNKNADIALEYSSKVDRTGVPILNKWINAGKRSVTGDPDLSAFDQSIKSTVNEYAKIISGSMGNTAAAEGEIKKVESMLNAAQTPQQVSAVLNLMKRETANRMAGFEEEKAALRDSMTGRKKTTSGPKPSLDDIFK